MIKYLLRKIAFTDPGRNGLPARQSDGSAVKVIASRFLGLVALFLLISCGEKGGKKAVQLADTASNVVANTEAMAPDDVTTGPDGAINAGTLAESVAAVIPPGYSVLDTSAGDLNLDAYPDLILVLKKDGEELVETDVDNPVKRPLLVMTGAADGSYAVVARNDNTVYCAKCGGMMGDPYTGITVRKGYFSVEHYGGGSWRWSRIVTYKYSVADKTWLLHKDGGESFNANEPEKVTEEVKTVKDFGRIPFEKFDIYAGDDEG